MRLSKLTLSLFLVLCSVAAVAQDVKAKFGKGITIIAPDSSMSMKFSTRFQTLFIAERVMENGSEIQSRFLTRRFRLKFDGFAYDPRLVYKIELALSNRDNGKVISQGNSAANIVLDAILKYRFIPSTQVWFGQFKLPGNRERVVSSQALQFVDRSLVNSRFTLDRDLGIMFVNKFSLGNVVFKDYWALTMGQGRNITIGDDGGLNYTGRVEVLPFGEFENKGDYFESDLAREETPKLSVGGGYSYNDEAMRRQGELGTFIGHNQPALRRDLSTAFADLMFKYRGFSVLSEYMNKQTDNPVLPDTSNFYYTGQGFVIQAGYLFKNNFEIAARYTRIEPSRDLYRLDLAPNQSQYTLGVSRYIVGHSLKIQSDISYTSSLYQLNELTEDEPDRDLMFRFQIEMAL